MQLIRQRSVHALNQVSPPHFTPPPPPPPFPPSLPQGVILYGEPGTGKTLLAKAVANSTSATFLRVVGSELIQKYLGDGPKLVRELFRVADELSPSIVFIGEGVGGGGCGGGGVKEGGVRVVHNLRPS